MSFFFLKGWLSPVLGNFSVQSRPGCTPSASVTKHKHPKDRTRLPPADCNQRNRDATRRNRLQPQTTNSTLHAAGWKCICWTSSRPHPGLFYPWQSPSVWAWWHLRTPDASTDASSTSLSTSCDTVTKSLRGHRSLTMRYPLARSQDKAKKNSRMH